MPKKLNIDLKQVEEMAEEFCTQDEIAEDMGFAQNVFSRRKDVHAAFVRGKNTARMSLRHMMFRAAKGGDRTMMIFLAKNELGYRDAPPPEVTERVDDPVKKLLERIDGEAADSKREAT